MANELNATQLNLIHIAVQQCIAGLNADKTANTASAAAAALALLDDDTHVQIQIVVTKSESDFLDDLTIYTS